MLIEFEPYLIVSVVTGSHRLHSQQIELYYFQLHLIVMQSENDEKKKQVKEKHEHMI